MAHTVPAKLLWEILAEVFHLHQLPPLAFQIFFELRSAALILVSDDRNSFIFFSFKQDYYIGDFPSSFKSKQIHVILCCYVVIFANYVKVLGAQTK